ncbi:THAP domain-containing protein 6-like [Parambassis ranga]|uniref:THAP domain-containing protein 6-like n=1 Tax=Parambassis ranga TaxID=210632 RepID=A0A6P7JTW2_9TELE|nr:THAP domain-containing protein 6-like [Parambassis ranga]
MVAECAAAKCRHKRSQESKQAGITFHTFPKDEVLRRKWCVAMHRVEGWKPAQWDVVCSIHFEDADFDRTGQTVRLRKGVIPTVFPNLPQHLQKTPVKPRSTRRSKCTPLQELPAHCSKKRRVSSLQCNDQEQAQPKLDHDYSCPGSDTLRLRWFSAQDHIQRLKQQLDKVRMRECRAKRVIKNLLGELKQKNVLIKELQMKLNEHNVMATSIVSSQPTALQESPARCSTKPRISSTSKVQWQS